MDDFKIGEEVCWLRAKQWNLKNNVGTILRVYRIGRDQQIMYSVGFPFGTLQMHAEQLQAAAAVATANAELTKAEAPPALPK